jgi:hypothetical protein
MTFWIQSPFRDARAEGRLELPIRGHKNDDLPFCPSQSLGPWRQGNISSPALLELDCCTSRLEIGSSVEAFVI